MIVAEFSYAARCTRRAHYGALGIAGLSVAAYFSPIASAILLALIGIALFAGRLRWSSLVERPAVAKMPIEENWGPPRGRRRTRELLTHLRH